MTEVVATISAEIVYPPEPLSEGKAKQLDKRIRLASIRVADESANLFDLLEEAEAGQIHVALNYRSWTAYVKDAVNITPANIEERKQMVKLMSGKGCSTRAIGGALNVDPMTVSRDLKGLGVALSTPNSIGTDGKTYPREKPVKQDVIDAEVIEESLEEKLARVATEAEEAEEWDEPEEPRKAIDVIDDFGENMDYLMPAVQAFTDQLKFDAELFPKARKRIAKSHLIQLQKMIAMLQLVVDELKEGQ